MEKLYELFAKVVAATALIISMLTLGAFASAFPVKWAWNYAVPGIFHLKEIGYWEAFCLIWLAGAFIKAAPSSQAKAAPASSVKTVSSSAAQAAKTAQ